MAAFDLYIDTGANGGELVSGPGSTTIVPIPPLVQGDTLALRIYPLKRTTTYPITTPFERISVAGKTLEVALGLRVGNTSLLYTQQYTWTASSDLADPYWSANLPMNTAAIDTLIGSGSQASAALEVKIIDGDGSITTVLSKDVTIKAAVIKAGSLAVPAGMTPLSMEAAMAIFLSHAITGPFTLTVGAYSVLITVDADGFHASPIA